MHMGGSDSCFDFSMMFCSRIPEYDHCTKKKVTLAGKWLLGKYLYTALAI